MQGVAVMKCNRCDREIPESESYEYFSEVLCDDCYLDIKFPAKACDPWAVYSATRTRESSGLKSTEGLTELQRAIYEFIRDKGKVTRGEVMENFNISEGELKTQVAVLRHCELAKGHKEDNRVYLVPFS